MGGSPGAWRLEMEQGIRSLLRRGVTTIDSRVLAREVYHPGRDRPNLAMGELSKAGKYLVGLIHYGLNGRKVEELVGKYVTVRILDEEG